MQGYYTAQICMSGHVILECVELMPEGREKYCSECGSPTTETCPGCSHPIRGVWRGSISTASMATPAYCVNCGAAFPWTAEKLAVAKEFADEIPELDTAEREQLKIAIDDLVSGGPKTELAASRFKRLVAKAGKTVGDALQRVVVDVVSETVKKTLLGG
jgi:hypothetical protein